MKAQTASDKTLINNALHSHSHGRGRGRRQEHEHEKGKGRQKSKGDRQEKGKSKERGRHQSQDKHKGKGRGNPQKNDHADNKTTAGETNKSNITKFKIRCTYCGYKGHLSRDCRKRMADEAHPSKETTNSSQKLTFAGDDEVEALFNNAFFSHDTDSESDPTDNEQTENVSENDIACEICDSDKDTDAQDNETHSVHQALQTPDEETPPPTLESSNATDVVEI